MQLRSLAYAALTVIVTTAGAIAASNDIESMVRNHYASVMQGRAISWDIELKRTPELREGEHFSRVVGEIGSATPRGSRICWVDIEGNGKSRKAPVTLRIAPVELAPVAIADIAPRTKLTPELFHWVAQSTESFGATKIPNAKELAGSWSKVRIPAGTVVTERRIEEIPIVVFGEPVKLVIRIGAIEIAAEGKALEDGRVGEKIRVLNLASESRIRGRVAEDGTVTVE